MEEKGELKVNRVGYKFIGWGTDNKKNSNSIYPIWQADEYNVSFHIEGNIEKDVMPKYQKAKYRDLVIEPKAPSMVGKKFIGWSLQNDNNGRLWNFKRNRMPAEHITLYAIFEPLEIIEANDLSIYLDELKELDKEKFIEKTNAVARNIEANQLVAITDIDFNTVKAESGVYPITLKTANGTNKIIFLTVITEEKQIVQQHEVEDRVDSEYFEVLETPKVTNSMMLPTVYRQVKKKYIVHLTTVFCALAGMSLYFLKKKK